MSSFARVDVIVLALMLVYVVVVFVHVCSRYYFARPTYDDAGKSKLATFLNAELRSLKFVGDMAPYLGLLGTCVGLLSAFDAVAMEKHAAALMITIKIALALITAAAGIPAAVLATCFYNYFCTHLESLEYGMSKEVHNGTRLFGLATKFPLLKRFSALPAFGLIAAPALAIAIAGLLTFGTFHTPKGFYVEVASSRCEYFGDDRLIVLHITERGNLFLNDEQVDWNDLADHLSDIYGMRKYRVLYLLADADIPFQTVASALDIIGNVPAPKHWQAVGVKNDKLDIHTRLITAKTPELVCPKPVLPPASSPRRPEPLR